MGVTFKDRQAVVSAVRSPLPAVGMHLACLRARVRMSLDLMLLASVYVLVCMC